jgi:DHA2 family multidrug resistance protein
MVIVVMAPLIVRLVKRISVSWMIGFGFTVLGCAMWYFASFNLATNYGKEAWARAVQGFGIAFLFVPTSQLAYSYLPKNKNNKASSLTNLFRNQGGSFGIAFVTTVLARRAQYHQSVLVTHVTSFDRTFSENVQSIANRFVDHGYSAADAAIRAVAQVHALVQQQANILAFLDCFWLLGLVAFIGPVLAIFIHKFNEGGGAAGAH